jgi:tRNA/tmRNA/rRNA uracil-C5-methylase (TrmA/RlmC/RlmD family)
MQIGDTVELEITDVVYPGKGLARLDGMVCFVPGTALGDRIRARVVKRKKRHCEAVVEQILDPSPARIEPVCPLAGTCPGCSYQHLRYEDEVAAKRAQLTGFLERFCGVALAEPIPVVPSPSELGYRNKITLHAGGGARPAVGYIAHDNATVLDVPSCPIALGEINALLARLRDDEAFMRTLSPGRSLTLRYAFEPGAYFYCSTMRHGAPDGCSVHGAYVVEQTVLGPLKVPVAGFFQVNPAVHNEMVGHVKGVLETTGAETLVDAYCGVGVFAIVGALAGIPHVLGIDVDRPSIRAAGDNCRERGLRGVEFLARPVQASLGEALACVDAARTTVIVDPARRGLEQAVRRVLAEHGPKHVVYVSCAPDTLARDVKELADAGYQVEGTRLFDMFPRTPYFETVLLLKRTGRT